MKRVLQTLKLIKPLVTEYGHYIQSQKMGWAYIPRVGIPSLKSALSDENHDFFIAEQDANRRAFLYFNKELKEDFYVDIANSGMGIGWNFNENPLDIDGQGRYNQYNFT